MTYNLESIEAFDKVRKRAFFEHWLNTIRRHPNDLLAFDAVQRVLGLHTSTDRGLREIELNKVVGSLGRYRDFTRSYLPKNSINKDRWRSVDELYYYRGFEPIKVYKVSNFYFVVDGNHRVSVNRAHGVKTIEAYVIEFQTSLPIHQNDDIENILDRIQKNRHSSNETQQWNGVQILLSLLSGLKVITGFSHTSPIPNPNRFTTKSPPPSNASTC